MYFLSAEEQRYVQRGLLPDARRQPVADELRGWSWAQPPLKPVYGQPLGVYEIAGKYCPTGRDVFLRRVQGVQAPPTPGMREGRALHQVVAHVLTQAKRLIYAHGPVCVPHLERLGTLDIADAWENAADGTTDSTQSKAHAIRAFEARRVAQRVDEVLARQPFVAPDALAALAVPVHVEVKLDGRCLGLSEHLAADAVSFPHMLVLDLKFGPKRAFHRLTTTGYALVLESLYETPVDLGCVVYVRVEHGRVVVERDLHVIGDELRQLFVEEREEKMRLVAEELDPGLPEACPAACPYLATCHRMEKAVPAATIRPTAANPGSADAAPAAVAS